MQTPIDEKILSVLDNYPSDVSKKIIHLRNLIIDTVIKINASSTLEETLKWGEPSYLVAGGSTIRIAWQKSSPNRYGIYFICSTTLVETFRELYGNYFTFEDNRAILFGLDDDIPEEQLRHCIELALTYHKVKHLPLLGA